MKQIDLLEAVLDQAPDRRKFFRKLSLAATALAATTIVPSADAQTEITDVDILQFALNLEYLEAEFYTVGTTGRTMDNFGVGITGAGTPGATTGGNRVIFNNSALPVQSIMEELAFDEQAHVNLLRAALTAAGVMPVAKPALNLSGLGFGFGGSADFIILARILEDIGVTAYAGAAPLITSKAYLGVAARILAAEAMHSGNIRLIVAQSRLSTTKVDGVDVVPPPAINTATSQPGFFALDNSALSAVRTPEQVLFLAYGLREAAMGGGFYPAGMNGKIKLSGKTA